MAVAGTVLSLVCAGISRVFAGAGRIVFAVLVFVWDREIPRFGDFDFGNLNRALAHGDAPREFPQRRFRSSFVEHVQFIITRGSVDAKGSILAGGIEVRRVEYYDDGAHGRMDIAKHAN